MDWTFEQIEGPAPSRKKLTLSGWAAPFGRPRKDPVAREIVKSRVQTTRYPGGSAQTRHAFGTNLEPMELKGRWMTKTFAFETANEVAKAWIDFVRDERTIRIAWGSIVSWTGFIEELEVARESEHEIAWRMRILLDDRDDKTKPSAPTRGQQSLDTNLVNVLTLFARLSRKQVEVRDNLRVDFLDQLDALIGQLNKPAAFLNNLAGTIDRLEKKTFATLQHLRGILSNSRQAILQMRETILVAQADAAILSRSAEADLKWVKYQEEFDTDSMESLFVISQLDRQAELEQKNEASKFITAREGDSWESLSTRATGSPEKAADIRSLNGSQYGEKPVPGQTYLVQ